MSIPIELVPNRLLLDSNFDGYKLSLKELTIKKREFPVSVDRILLNTNQFSILHAQLYGLHNHLIGDPYDENDSVYFIDSDRTVCKTYIDPFSDDLIGPIIVWHVPQERRREQGDCNFSMKFITENLAVAGDGTGLLYILDTGSRKDDDSFTIRFSGDVAGIDERFVIIDAVSKIILNETQEVHLLLLSLKQESGSERYVSVIHWITLSKMKHKEWTQVALRQLKTEGYIQYLAFEKSCESIYVVSDSECKFTVNSEVPVIEKTADETKKLYTWSQNFEDIILDIPLGDNANKNLVSIKVETNQIEVKYDNNTLIRGELYQHIDSDMITWSVQQNTLKITMNKRLSGSMWTEMIKGDKTGEYIQDQNVAQQVHERLAHLCSDTEASPQLGAIFNSEQIEECDFENDKSTSFVRLCGKTNTVTHSVNLGSHKVLMQPSLSLDLPLAVGIRHDVDICLWQPKGDTQSFELIHEGTLHAFAYVQASKANRKFMACPPDMSYSVICDTMKHIFLYRQKIPLSSTELRHRISGRRVQNVAEQQVISLSNEEIMGIYPTNSILFVLQRNCVLAIKVENK